MIDSISSAGPNLDDQMEGQLIDRSHTWKILKKTVRGGRPPWKTDTTATKQQKKKNYKKKEGKRNRNKNRKIPGVIKRFNDKDTIYDIFIKAHLYIVKIV